MSRPLRLYVSGPMTGLPEFNFPAFHEAARHLRAVGYEVINPAEHDEEPGLPWEHYLRKDIKLLMDCDAVATLPEWRKSRGATLEIHIATKLSMRVRPVWSWTLIGALQRYSDAIGEILSRWPK